MTQLFGWPGWPAPIYAPMKGTNMTQPVTPPASKAKTVVGLVGGLLAVAIPLILEVSTHLPEPWPSVVGGVVALATALGIYHAPYSKSP